MGPCLPAGRLARTGSGRRVLAREMPRSLAWELLLPWALCKWWGCPSPKKQGRSRWSRPTFLASPQTICNRAHKRSEQSQALAVRFPALDNSSSCQRRDVRSEKKEATARPRTRVLCACLYSLSGIYETFGRFLKSISLVMSLTLYLQAVA